MTIPNPAVTGHDDVQVKVTPIVAGTITLPERIFIEPVDQTSKRKVPCLCFLIEHPKYGRFMFDLGLRSSAKDYIPEIQSHLPNRRPVTHRPSAAETLRAQGIELESLRAVILSHVHWDHHGDPESYPNVPFYLGYGSLSVLANGLPGLGSHSHFDKNLLENSPHYELKEAILGQPVLDASTKSTSLFSPSLKWQALEPFVAAADLFGDGSTLIIPAPGHLPGHINLLCRVGPKKWAYLGGDAYHDARLLTGEKTIATWEEGGHTCCVHIDREQAHDTMRRIQEFVVGRRKNGVMVEVMASHDSAWLAANEHRCLGLPVKEEAET